MADDLMGRDGPTTKDRIDLIRWHLDRYDRLRGSTTSRASVILSATAILSAGSVVELSLVLSNTTLSVRGPQRTLLIVEVGLTAALVVVGLIHATTLLATSRQSRQMLADGQDLPAGLIFNGSDTIREISSFGDFAAIVETQGHQEILQAAEVELWITIHQHRWRYVRLRIATRLLRLSALAFLVVLLSTVAIALVNNG